jgi:hypothetical protein
MVKKAALPASMPPARRSRSAAASKLAEMRRIERMTVEQRIHAALTMSRRFAWLQPAPRTP